KAIIEDQVAIAIAKDQSVTEFISEESSKGLRRPHYIVEEGVQKEEREKYRSNIDLLKQGDLYVHEK
ncbi:hypothetical protein H8959_019456, partial [Pygathrix nigripes]